MRQSIEIDVHNPDEFWFATFADGFIGEDPDAEDGYERSYRSGPADWTLIADMMTDISGQLRTASFEVVAIKLEPPESIPSFDAILAWFSLGDMVLGDPGNLINGRHRLWNSWRARPDAVLPIRSAIRTIVSEAGEPAPGEANGVLSSAQEGLWTLNPHQRAWFEARR